MKCFKCCKTRSNGTPLLQNVTINFCVCFTEQRDISYVTNQPDTSAVKVSDNHDSFKNFFMIHEEISNYEKSNYGGRFSWKKYREIYV